MYLTLTTGDGNFDDFKRKLQERMTARMANAGDVTLPTILPVLNAPACSQYIANDTYPNDVTKVSFGFKADADPASQYPLRGIKIETKNAGTASVGTISSEGVIIKTGVSALQIFDLTGVTSINSMISYYSENAKDPKDTRYGRRLVAIVISYSKGADHGQILLAGPGSLFKTAEANANGKLLDAIETAVNQFNSKGDYRIFSEVKDHIVPIQFKWGEQTETRKLANIGYNQFQGRSTSYINNFSFVFAAKTKDQLGAMFSGVKKFSVSSAFVPNAVNQDTSIKLVGSGTDSARTLTVSEKSSTMTFKIPGFEIADLFSVESPFEYSESERHSLEREKTRSTERSVEIEMTVPTGSYVVRGYPSTRSFNSQTIVGLFSKADGTEPDYEIAIPTSTPCVVATQEYDLAKKLLDFI